ncbi:alpha/beta hydrolase [Streptomyces sp. NPDC058464]|uniref:alpha/beta hydrolase n=1 Tax=Streptomyces sp. NPDC058464 TaxID=3346511 RepID=UPI003658D5EC
MELDDTRLLLEQLHMLAAEPTDVTYEEVDADGVPAIIAKPLDAAADRLIVYAHGGGMALNSASSHRKLAAHLAKAAGMHAAVVDYRLAPENPFPAQIDDLVTVHRWLRRQGIAPEHTATAGDSAGGNLAITSVLKLRDLGEPLPAAIVAFSPWIDMQSLGDTFVSNADSDALMSREVSERMAGLYLGEVPRTEPLANPLYADLSGLPPVFVTAGEAEVLLDGAVRFVERARAAGVDTTFECAPGQEHAHELMAGKSKEADASLANAGRWMRSLFVLHGNAGKTAREVGQ